MKREGHDGVKFFVGPEVEHTPAFSKKTLFVVGKQKLELIEKLAREHKTPHVFLGANHSFNVDNNDPYWDSVITSLLDQGFWVTLDYPAHQHESVLKMLNPGIWQSRLFVPMLSVRIPKVQTSNANLTVKIDDIDFKATNAGVWCLHHHELTDSNRFTDWVEYGNDEVIAVAEPTVEKKVEKKVEVKVEEKPVQNNQEIGLEANSNPTAEEVLSTVKVATPEAAADAYAEGAKTDPLGKEESKKPKSKKVAA